MAVYPPKLRSDAMLWAVAAVGFAPPTAGPPRSCSRRAPAIACSSAQPEPDPADLRASLDRLFTLSVDPDDDDGWAGAAQLEGELIRDLPLWRVQWPASPACSQVYNVHVPHYTHMFSTVDAASRALGVIILFDEPRSDDLYIEDVANALLESTLATNQPVRVKASWALG